MSLASFASLATSILVAALFIMWLHYWRRLFVDQYRQNLFRVRDKLFDIAAEGQIEFEDPAYQAMRYMLNGMIRYAHRMSFTTLALIIAFRKTLFGVERMEEFSDKRLEEAKNRYPQIYEMVSEEAAMCTVIFLFRASMFARVALGLAWARQVVTERSAHFMRNVVDEIGIEGARQAKLVR